MFARPALTRTALRASTPGDQPSACITAWKPGIQRLAKQLDKLLGGQLDGVMDQLAESLWPRAA